VTKLKMNELKPGDMIDGRYKVVRTIDRTVYGCLYEVNHQPIHGEKAAVETRRAAKVVSGSPHVREGFECNLIKSAQAWSRIDHPNVARVLDVGETQKGVFIVTEMLDGRDLGAVLSQKKRLEWKDARPVFLDACAALSALHEAGIVHGDVHPDQLLLVEGPDGMATKLLAPDMIHTAFSEPYGETGWMIGRLQYMSPEQINIGLGNNGPAHLSGMVDVYALGVALHRTLTGQPVFEGETNCAVLFSRLSTLPKTPSERVPGLSSEVDAVVMRALQIDPAQRYQTAAEFRAAIESAQS